MIKPVILCASIAAGMMLATPATAYDPCQRATERAQAADAAVYAWINSHCTSGGQCIGNPAEFRELQQRALNAREARNRACA